MTASVPLTCTSAIGVLRRLARAPRHCAPRPARVPFARTVLIAITAAGLATSPAPAQITIPTVPVGDPGNAADTRAFTGFGAVTYTYRIGTYEVTTGQYATFLNAVARTDTYGLYNAAMAVTSPAVGGCGITRTGSSGSFTYAVDPAFANRPVNYVSFWDALRFANWLHNAQPIGPQNTSTTESGAYTLTPGGIAANSVTRNPGWKWALTSASEWYKAAYYKGGGPAAGYWLYPTRSNTAPGRDLADAAGNNANCYAGSGPFPIASPYYTTPAGTFPNSPSPYGTFDQGGNVWEWNEAIFQGDFRFAWGSSFDYGPENLRADFQSGSYFNPLGENWNTGFRVAQVFCRADFNGLNGATVQDVFDFLTAWFAGDTRADINNAGGVSVQDVFDFLAAWFAGC